MNLFVRFLTLVLFMVGYKVSLTQNMSINSTGNKPDSSAMLDVQSADKGLLIPRTDTATVNGSGVSLASGLLIYQTFDSKFYYYNGVKWVVIDGPNTDSQTIDAFSLSGSTLSLSLEDDGQSNRTVNLSSINTDNQTIDAFSLSGSTLSLSLEDDGQATKTIDLTALLPVGSIIMYPGSSTPTNWLICNGSTFSASTYPALNSLLGGNTLPNFSGRFPLGVGNSGTNGSTNHSLGSTGGEETHTLTLAEMPSHAHGSGTLKTEELVLSQTNDGTGNQDARDGGGKKLYEYNDITGNTSTTGSSSAHNNMPPFRTVNFIIKAR